MGALFGWVDFADGDRQRMKELIASFREPDTRDELGLATIRDAFANMLFPGTSVVQTRARYMLFVPWAYKRLERKVPLADAEGKARTEEARLMTALLATAAANDKDVDGAGVIGRMRGSRIQRLPSNVYWAGLGAWGIRTFDGSTEAYHRALGEDVDDDDRRGDDGSEHPRQDSSGWDPALPLAPAGFPDGSWMDLEREEAEYLRDRVDGLRPRPLLSHLLHHSRPRDVDVDLVWKHGAIRKLPDDIQRQVRHARALSETMHGASLLYNLMLAEARGVEDWIESYRGWFVEWSDGMKDRRTALDAWDLEDLWALLAHHGTRISRTSSSCRFVTSWLDLVRSNAGGIALSQRREAQELIRAQEWSSKGKRARLHDDAMLKRWGGASGTSQLDFRWRRARVIVRDILDGLGRTRGRGA